MTGVLAASVREISGLLRDFFVSERTTEADGFLQRLHPTVKLVGVTVLVFLAAVTPHPGPLVLLGSFAFGLSRLSSIPLRLLAARTALVPLASTVAVLPQLVLVGGTPVFATADVSVTAEGVEYVVTFGLRVAVSVSFLSLLVLTTRFSAVLASLRELGVPATLVRAVALTYRYLFLFFFDLQRMLAARESRAFRPASIREAWRDVGRLTGALFVRSVERGERVHRATLARGGSRTPSPYVRSRRPGRADGVFAGAVLALVVTTGVVAWGGAPVP